MTARSRVPAGWYLPRGFLRQYKGPVEASENLVIALAQYLRRAKLKLRQLPVDAVAEVIDQAAEYWLARCANPSDPLLLQISKTTGLSLPMVQRCLQAEQTSSRQPDLLRTLDSELGDRHCLDDFVWRGLDFRFQRALGPMLTFGVLPGNIPGLSHLPMMRSLLVKSAFLGKAASNEPLYAAAYAHSLARLHPTVGDAMAVVYWPGGQALLERAAIEQSDAVIAFGSQNTVDTMASMTPRSKVFVGHGHKMGLVVVDARWVLRQKQEIQKLAMDVAMYDQAACLAPQAIISVGTRADARRLGRQLGQAMHELHRSTLPAAGDLETRVRRRTWLDSMEMHGGDVVAQGDYGCVVLQPKASVLEPTCGGRAIQIAAVSSDAAAVDQAEQWAPWLQNVALSVPRARVRDLADALAVLGCSRITRAGAMAFPSMRWHHDGMMTLAAMVRFCDVEGAAEMPLNNFFAM